MVFPQQPWKMLLKLCLWLMLSKMQHKKFVDLSNGVKTGVDNTNENIWHQDSVSNRTSSCIKWSYIVRCSYHLAHRVASKSGTTFTKVTGFDMELDQVNNYGKFKGTAGQKVVLIKFMNFVDVDWIKIFRFVSTRLLFSEICLWKWQKIMIS